MFAGSAIQQKEKKRKDYAFRRQFVEKPSIIPGCPEQYNTPYEATLTINVYNCETNMSAQPTVCVYIATASSRVA